MAELFTEEDVRRYASVLHVAEDGEQCDCPDSDRKVYPILASAVLSALAADGRLTRPAGALRLNQPMVARLRRCAADTSPNWAGRIEIFPPEARELVALIDRVEVFGA